MKNSKTKISLNPFIRNEIKELNDKARISKQRYRIAAIALSLLNLAMIAVAATAIDLLVIYHTNNKAPGENNVGVILTAFAAALVVVMFFTQFTITIFRSKRKQDIYKDALDEIQLEVIKHDQGIEEYSKKSKDKLLEEKCLAIKNKAIKHRHKRGLGSLLLKGLTGGEDA